MPEYYNLYSNDGFEVGEEMPDGMHEADVLMVDDYEDMLDDESFLLVEEDEAHDEPEYDLVPGSNERYVENYTDDSVEVRETSWTDDGDHSKFVAYLKDKILNIPSHSGKTIPGCERALAYLKSCEQEISRAMRSDLEGKIDEEQVDVIRQDIYKMTDRLENHINRLRKSAGIQQVNFVTAEDIEQGISKTAGTPILNVYMTPFERAIVGTIINAKVSAGRNIEEVYAQLKAKYNFDPREELAIQQLIADHGYPVYKDRGLLNEPTDPASGDNIEWQTNYHA